jgi:hypothetical protein
VNSEDLFCSALCVHVQCGRPAVKDRCKDCGAEIGGERHVHAAGNRAAVVEWVTLLLHCEWLIIIM